jgi:hypothetical protein
VEPAPAVLTVLGKPDCHLCHVMADAVRAAIGGLHATLVERDVREDPETFARYRDEIPVLLFEGRELARHRVRAAELRSTLLALGIAAR